MNREAGLARRLGGCAGLLPAVLAGAVAVSGLKLHHTRLKNTLTRPKLIQTLRTKIEHDASLALRPIDCRTFDQNSDGGQSVCCGSDQRTDRLVSGLGAALEPPGFTPGWRKDDMTWASFYEMRDGSKRTFGVSVVPVKGNWDLEAVKEIKAFRNFITVTVDRPE